MKNLNKLLFLVFLSSLPTLATSQSSRPQINVNLPCAPTVEVISALKDSFNELPMFLGKTDDGVIFTVWVQKLKIEPKTWTITATSKELTCYIGSGQELSLNLESFKL